MILHEADKIRQNEFTVQSLNSQKYTKKQARGVLLILPSAAEK
ncbi:hypothetical protein MNBD_ALPHA11-448 [hydrothermal vent metagenome]|uniref:Uncharacterized protein n=1 Tax=hydrothermal vent metagenome TaxID=652676 RepID=A0A3B0U594_9ZZZZ